MLQAQASERELIDQFLAALRSLPEVRAELERPGAPSSTPSLRSTSPASHPRARRVEEGRLPARRPSARLADQRPCPPATRRRERRRAAGGPGRRVHLAGGEGAASSRAGRVLRQRGQPLPAGPGSLPLRRSAAAQVVVPLHAIAVHGTARAGPARPVSSPPGLVRREGPGRADAGLVSDGVPGAHRDGALRLAGVARAGTQQAEAPSGARGAARCVGEAAELDPCAGPATLLRARDEARRPDGAPRPGVRGARRRLRRQLRGAAQRYAPFLSAVSQVRCRLLAGSGADAAIADLGARVVSEGANLAVIEAKSTGDLLFRERVGGVWLASPIHVYLDLLRGEGRAKDMADHLRKERIGF
jgi:hypothetical protein